MKTKIDTSLIETAKEIAPIVEKYSEEGERERRLSRPVLEALREAGLMRMMTPRSLGGLETDPVRRPGRDDDSDSAVQHDFPEAAIRYRLFGRNPNRSFAARVLDVSHADKPGLDLIANYGRF